MRIGVLFSGGKDSTLAIHRAVEKEEVVCLICLNSKNPESYMFHTPNIDVTLLQAKALNLPIINKITKGIKEEELVDLKVAIKQAIKLHKIEGIVTGAVESVYQAERVQRICNKLNLWCFNPLWKSNQKELLEETVNDGFKTIISGIFAYPLDDSWLGKELDSNLIEKLVDLQKKFGLSPSGEGGEIETTVLDAPLFKKRIRILSSFTSSKGNSGIFKIEKAELIEK